MSFVEEIKCVNPVRRGAWLVPCGKCYWCKDKQATDWIIRLNEEYFQHNSSLFVTLTYDDEHLPRSPTGFPVVCRYDVQLFMRYLRRRGYKFKYYGVSEYGPTSFRPHYHLVLFGLDVDAYADILACWNKGFISVYRLTGGAINYVSRYTLLNSELPDYILKSDYKPFKFVSKGLGRSYCDDFDNVNYHRYTMDTTYLLNGYKKSLPRYYRNKIFEDSTKEYFKDEYAKKTFEMVANSRVRTKEDCETVLARQNKRSERYNRFRDKVLNEFTKKAKI